MTSTCDMVGKVVVPGDKVYDLPETGIVRIGRGLQQDSDVVRSLRAGQVLQTASNNKLWVLSNQKRYIPQLQDSVIGIITRRGAEFYEVDINGPFTALLPVLAFEGATRRNRPNLSEGDLIYARIDTANRDIQPTLICTDAAGKAAGLGPLLAGYMLPSCSTNYTRRLMSQPPPAVLIALGKAFEYELAVGANGRIWINAKTSADTILASLAIQQSEGLSAQQQEALVAALLKGPR